MAVLSALCVGILWCAPAAASDDLCPVVGEQHIADQYYVAVDWCDGRGPQILTVGTSPRLSPDRSQIVYRKWGYRDQMRVMAVDGTADRVILDSSDEGRFYSRVGLYPQLWWPDGQSILFNYGYIDSGVGVVGVDGSNPRILGRLMRLDAGAWPSILSPDGTMLMLGDMPDEDPILEVLELATLTRRLISPRSYTGSWSPDSRWVAFKWYQHWEGAALGLEVVRVDGTERVDVAALVRQYTGEVFEPEPVSLVTWSADGSELAVQDRSRGGLVAVRVDGTSLRPVAAHFDKPAATDPTLVPQATWGEAKEQSR